MRPSPQTVATNQRYLPGQKPIARSHGQSAAGFLRAGEPTSPPGRRGDQSLYRPTMWIIHQPQHNLAPSSSQALSYNLTRFAFSSYSASINRTRSSTPARSDRGARLEASVKTGPKTWRTGRLRFESLRDGTGEQRDLTPEEFRPYADITSCSSYYYQQATPYYRQDFRSWSGPSDIRIRALSPNHSG